MQMSNAFSASRLKIERARKHLSDLENLLNDFVKEAVGVYPNDCGEIGVSYSTELLTDIALTIGDAIHNARSALDMLVCDVARIRGCKSIPTRLSFPVCKTKSDLEARVNEIRDLIGGTVSDILINDLKSYGGCDGNALLCALYELDISDKHKLLIPVLSQAIITGLDTGNLTMSFAKGQVLADEPVIPSLVKMLDHVASVVDKFDIFYG